MTMRKVLALTMVSMCMAALSLPAVASAETTQSFNAQVYAENLPMYSFTISNDHIEYYNQDNASLGVESGLRAAGDHSIGVDNTGASNLTLMVQASSEPTATDGTNVLTVPLATGSGDWYDTANSSTASGGVGKMGWYWLSCDGLGNPAIAAGLVHTNDALNLGTVSKGSYIRLDTEVWTPTHWPHDTVLDYNWGATIIAYTADPV